LGKKERLKSRKQLDLLFKEGKSVSMPPFRILYILDDRQGAVLPRLQFGVGASSRNFKKAVDRNLIKRRIRESYRLQKAPLELALAERDAILRIFFIYTGRELPPYEALYGKMQLALQKIEKEIARQQRP